ncbi:hypothetical protein [Natrinema marinum]|uniref:hypothetical protein n=1 Tax=Natrinema marinum TaxID=2961598 RepID=UPI0020C8A3BC|nr:hypothetical protein [Natrinema marinum]
MWLHIVSLDRLPDPATDEAMAAIEGDTYETDGELILPSVIEIDESYLMRHESERTYYDMSVETDEGATWLRAEERLPEADTVSVKNTSETDLTVDIRLEHENELLVEETVALDANRTTWLDGDDAEYRYGSYRAEVVVHDGDERVDETIEWSVTDWSHQPDIRITPREVTLRGAVSEKAPCEWNDSGELVSGPKAS